MKLKFALISTFAFFVFTQIAAQATNLTDTANLGIVTVVNKDPRIDLLGKKMAEFNYAITNKPGSIKIVRGYRLMILSTNDRTMALNVRSKLLQQYPEQKVYMTFQSPYIKLKFGNFPDKAEAEKYRKRIAMSDIVSNNIYTLSDMIEVKIEKMEEEIE
ncbi:MAG: SPOR domain-containing protein [Ferruginibacter sp.]